MKNIIYFTKLVLTFIVWGIMFPAVLIAYHPIFCQAEKATSQSLLELSKKDSENSEMHEMATVDTLQDNESKDTDSSMPEQASYPGVENHRFDIGGDNEPSISLNYPAFGIPKVDAAILAFITARAKEYEDDVKDSFGSNEEKPESYGTWEMTGYYTIEHPSPDIASITFNIYAYSGGAHGNLEISCQNYDLKSGKLLNFEDLFKRPEKALLIMSELSAKRLKDDLGEDSEDDMIASGTSPEAANFYNLTLVPDGLYVEFQPYQVGPWSIGAQRVKFSLADLAAAKPGENIWPDIAKLNSLKEKDDKAL